MVSRGVTGDNVLSRLYSLAGRLMILMNSASSVTGTSAGVTYRGIQEKFALPTVLKETVQSTQEHFGTAAHSRARRDKIDALTSELGQEGAPLRNGRCVPWLLSPPSPDTSDDAAECAGSERKTKQRVQGDSNFRDMSSGTLSRSQPKPYAAAAVAAVYRERQIPRGKYSY